MSILKIIGTSDRSVCRGEGTIIPTLSVHNSRRKFEKKLEIKHDVNCIGGRGSASNIP